MHLLVQLLLLDEFLFELLLGVLAENASKEAGLLARLRLNLLEHFPLLVLVVLLHLDVHRVQIVVIQEYIQELVEQRQMFLSRLQVRLPYPLPAPDVHAPTENELDHEDSDDDLHVDVERLVGHSDGLCSLLELVLNLSQVFLDPSRCLLLDVLCCLID